MKKKASPQSSAPPPIPPPPPPAPPPTGPPPPPQAQPPAADYAKAKSSESSTFLPSYNESSDRRNIRPAELQLGMKKLKTVKRSDKSEKDANAGGCLIIFVFL